MTLVVANRIARGIRLIGDLKITARDAILRGELKGALKVIILRHFDCPSTPIKARVRSRSR